MNKQMKDILTTLGFLESGYLWILTNDETEEQYIAYVTDWNQYGKPMVMVYNIETPDPENDAVPLSVFVLEYFEN